MLQALELERCRRDNVYWFENWAWTFDPRNADTGIPPTLPFDLWPRQRDFVRWLDERQVARNDGLVEKARDAGFTWLAGGWAWHRWRWVPGFVTTFGSRKLELVDRIGNPDTIFEKIRILVRHLPPWMLPVGFDSRLHDNFARMVNPENGNVIAGEGGDEIGRGGRASALILDEAAFLEHPDRVEQATSATARVRIWASSVNGIGNHFHRKRMGGSLKAEQIFVFDWRDDPRKDDAWAKAEQERLEPHVWASEYERDYTASVEGICIPGRWVTAAQNIAALLKAKRGIDIEPGAHGIGGLDVGGGGKARSVAIARFGPVVTSPISWGEPDTNETAARALDYAQAQKLTMRDGKIAKVTLVNYDPVGVGHGVLGVMKRARPGITTQGINVGVPPSERVWPDGETSEVKFGNRKAELWFLARERFKSTYEMTLFVEGKPGGIEHPVSDLISLPPTTAGNDSIVLAGQLSSVKWFRNEKGKTVIETKVQLRQRSVVSPDHAEAFVLTFEEDSVVDQWRRAFGGR